MTSDELLLCSPWCRDLFVAWNEGEITFEKAVFLARRVVFHERVEFLRPLDRVLLWVYDLLWEP